MNTQLLREQSPRPSHARAVLAQALWEGTAAARNAEQLLLIVVIPVLLVLVGSWIPALEIAPSDHGLARIAVASVIACCFTSVAIGTAFERRALALSFLGTTPLGRSGLLAGKVLAVGAMTTLSIAAVVTASLAVGWRLPQFDLLSLLLILIALVLGGGLCVCWAFLMAGTLRAESVLALANAIFLLLLLFGGIAAPLDVLPSFWAAIAGWLPSAALITALQQPGEPAALVTLAVWTGVGLFLSLRFFRWEDRAS